MQPNNIGDNQGSWAYRSEDETHEPQQLPAQKIEPVQWTASEFISHHKTSGWYAKLTAGFFVLCAAIYLLTKDIISVIFISIVVVLFFIIAAKKPRQRSYIVDDRGISIDEKFYPYSGFKSFALVNEGSIDSIVFLPLKRLMPEITVYFAPEDGDRILNALSVNLSNDQRKEQGIDRLMKRLHF